MGGWYEAAVEKLKLLYNLLKKQILSSEYIQIDESVIPVIDNEKHKTRKGYEWCLRDGITGDVVFQDRKSTRLNSSHANISYPVFCLKKKHTSELQSRQYLVFRLLLA